MSFKELADKLYSKLEREEVDGEIIFTKKRRVYPIIDEQGKINWFNFLTGGTYWKLIGVIAFIVIIIGFALEYNSNLSYCAQILSEQQQNITNLLNPFITP